MFEPQSSAATAQGAPETATWDPAVEKGENGTNPVAVRRNQQTVSQVAAPVFTKLGNPGPLGLLSFAITTFVVGLLECGAGYAWSIIPPASELDPNLLYPDFLIPTPKAMLALTKPPSESWFSWGELLKSLQVSCNSVSVTLLVRRFIVPTVRSG